MVIDRPLDRDWRESLPPITVVVGDTDKRRLGTCVRLLRAARGITVVATAGAVRDTIGTVVQQPDLLLLDLKMTRADDAATIPLVRTKSPHTQIILLTGRASDGQVLAAISQGARGYLDAKLLRPFLVKAVRAVAAGESWVSRAMVGKLIDQLARLVTHDGRPRRT
jgi:DNA-binding NarL/FixJ family response regulator